MMADVAHPSALPPAPPHAQGPTIGFRVAAAALLLLLAALLVVLPHGEMSPSGHVVVRADGTHEFEHDESRLIVRGIGNMLGTLATLALAASLALAYLPATPARRRNHARVGWAIMVLSVGHVALMLADGSLRGVAPGSLSLVLFAAHGATGAMKARIARAWGAAWWRYAHRATAWAAVLFLVEHVLLASWHWGLARWFEQNGW